MTGIRIAPLSYSSDAPRPGVPLLSPGRFRARLVGGVVLLNVFVFILVALSIHQSYHQYQERAEITTRNLAQALENELAGTIRTDDLALFAVMGEYNRQRASGGVDGRKLNAHIEQVRSRLLEIDALRITDAQGMLVYGSDVGPGVKINLADRPHFIRLRDDSGAGLVISGPQTSRANQKKVIVLARRIDQPDGSFGGMAFAAITLEQLSRTFSALDVGRHGVVALRDGDLGVIVRYPALQAGSGATGDKTVARELLDMVAAGKTVGTFTAYAGSDSVQRAYSYRKIGAYPLYLFVGLATEDYLAEWRHEATLQTALAALFALMTSLAAWLVYRIWKHQVTLVEALARQEVKFRNLVETTSDWIWEIDETGVYTYSSPGVRAMLGYEPAEVIGKTPFDLMPEKEAERVAAVFDAMAATREAFINMENTCLRKDGHPVIFETSGIPVIDPGGTFRGYRGIDRDITGRKQAEAALRESENRHRLLIENAPLCIHEIDMADRITSMNRAGLLMMGVEDESKICGLPYLDTVSADDRKRIGALLARAHDGKTSQFEFVSSGPGGRIYKSCFVPIRNEQGGVVKLMGITEDITERKEADAKVAESESHLRSIIENEPECIKIIDARGRLMQMNPAGLEMIEADSLEQVAGRPVLNLIAPEYRQDYADLMRRVLAGEVLQMEYEVLGLKGGRRWLETHAVAMQDKGQTVHLAVTRDISKRKKAEAELLRSNAELEQFSYSISHDMRQPLRMIASYLQLLELGLGERLDAEQREYFNFAIDGARRLDTMLMGLLEYSRVGRKGEPPAWVDSRAILDEALLFLQPAIAEARAVVRIEGDWPRIYASPDEMLRLMQNLIGNAVKFRVAGRMPEITVSSETVANEWRLSVADNGVGIIPGQIGRLFQVFQRLQSRAAYEGTGIGLALCRKIAEHHGGRIRAESPGEDCGSTFRVGLPMRSEDVGATSAHQEPESAVLQGAS